MAGCGSHSTSTLPSVGKISPLSVSSPASVGQCTTTNGRDFDCYPATLTSPVTASVSGVVTGGLDKSWTCFPITFGQEKPATWSYPFEYTTSPVNDGQKTPCSARTDTITVTFTPKTDWSQVQGGYEIRFGYTGDVMMSGQTFSAQPWHLGIYNFGFSLPETPSPSPSPPLPDPNPIGCASAPPLGSVGAMSAKVQTDRQVSVGSVRSQPLTGAATPAASACPPEPTPSPLAAVGFSQPSGEFVEDESGKVSISDGRPSAVTYLTPSQGVVTASQIRAQATLSAPGVPVKLPPGYATAPPVLPDTGNAIIATVESVLKQAVTFRLGIRVPTPACYAFLNEQRAIPAQRGSARNPAYYQIQAYCDAGASITPNSLVSHWSAETYNTSKGSSVHTIAIAETCDEIPHMFTFGTLGNRCFTKPRLVPLVTGHAEINAPEKLEYGVSILHLDTEFRLPGQLHPVEKFFLNDRAVPYPVAAVQPQWGPTIVDDMVPPPVQGANAYFYEPNGCGNNLDKASTALGRNLKNGKNLPNKERFPNPAPGVKSDPSKGILGMPPAFDAHHIKPSCWSGTNDAINGIWLPNAKNALYGNIHNEFTTWWLPSNFTPGD